MAHKTSTALTLATALRRESQGKRGHGPDIALRAADLLQDQDEALRRLREFLALDTDTSVHDVVKAAMDSYYGPQLYHNNDPIFGNVIQRLRDVMDSLYKEELGFHSDGDYVGTAATLLELWAEARTILVGGLNKFNVKLDATCGPPQIAQALADCVYSVEQINEYQEALATVQALQEQPQPTLLAQVLALEDKMTSDKRSTRELSLVFTKIQEARMWLQENTVGTEEVAHSIDPTKPWVHYVPVKERWSAEETHKALSKYMEAIKGRLPCHSFDHDLFLPEVDGKSTRIVVIG